MRNYIIVVLMIGLATVMSGQTVLLINGEPYSVNLVEGQLSKINNTSRSFTGYERPTNDPFIKTIPPYMLTGERADDADIVLTEKALPKGSINASGSVPTESIDKIDFKKYSSIISNKGISVLKALAEEYKQFQRSVNLQAWYIINNQASQELADSRLAACRKILELNGVPQHFILTNSTTDREQRNSVKIIRE